MYFIWTLQITVMSAWSLKRRRTKEDQFWLVNLLAAGDLEEQTNPRPVHVNRVSRW